LEALPQYHAKASVNPMAHGRRYTFDGSSRTPYGLKRAGAA
jgi:hypothetical protein